VIADLAAQKVIAEAFRSPRLLPKTDRDQGLRSPRCKVWSNLFGSGDVQ